MKLATQVLSLILALSLLAGCATPRGAPGALTDLKPGERPALATDEAGLWMAMDRVEANLKTSGHVVTDPALNSYVQGIVCRLAGPHCASIRVYIVQTPHLNASMAPNGMMQVWTGLILHADNEAQLAYVLGHEIGHYVRRHSVQLFRDVRLKSNATLFLNVLAGAAGVGFVGPLIQLAALSSVFAFSRDNEREADEVGFELMVLAGYDPHEAAKIWEALLAQRAATKDSQPSIFFATHPPTGERVATLKALAEKTRTAPGELDLGRERFLAATGPFRATMLRDELRLRRSAATQLLLDRLAASGSAPGEIQFFQGELYRLRGESGDDVKAIAAYEKAAAAGDVPPEAHRSLGLVLMKARANARARAAFFRYLELRPDAQDGAMIRDYLKRLE